MGGNYVLFWVKRQVAHSAELALPILGWAQIPIITTVTYFLGRDANNQNGKFKMAADCQLFSHVQCHLNYNNIKSKLCAKHAFLVLCITWAQIQVIGLLLQLCHILRSPHEQHWHLTTLLASNL